MSDDRTSGGNHSGGMGVSPVCGTVSASIPGLQMGGTPVPPDSFGRAA